MAEPKLLPCPPELLEELADDLEALLEREYPEVERSLYPRIVGRRFERNMEPVRRARKLLKAHNTRADARADAE